MPEIGQTISHYKIIEKIGQGGMGIVYLALDTSLNRKVAIKFLPLEHQQDETARMRFSREARSAAALDHPYICNIHEVGETESESFIVMEYIEGQTLQKRLEGGLLPLKESLRIGAEIAEALEEAHGMGIIHRDLKPSNIILTRSGHAKVMDFGLAKHAVSDPQDSQAETATYLTQEGSILGTLPYMSPEQIHGKSVDSRSDIFSFGIIMFEIVTGEHPFRRDSHFDIADAILNDKPPPLSKYAVDIPSELTALIHKMMTKNTDGRYQRVTDVKKDIAKLLTTMELQSEAVGPWRKFGSAKFVVPAFVAIIVLGYLAFRSILQEREISWARNVALPQIAQLISEDNFVDAYQLATDVEAYIPGDSQLLDFVHQVSLVLSVHTNPADARLYIKEYGSREEGWELLGNTPLEDIRVSRGFKLFKIIKEGYAERYGILGFDDIWIRPINVEVNLVPENSVLPDMVFVDGGSYTLNITGLKYLNFVQLNNYQIDKYEVTNKDYMEFVDAGGYRERKYWKYDFVKDDEVLSWEEAMAEFVDKTGRPGPANWELGQYPEEMGEHPVSGVSWYEAAAYAEFAGKQLPSVFHWNKAAGIRRNDTYPVILHSNFTDLGTSPVGTYQGIGPYGTFDMAGNVREWCWNGFDNKRFLLGGSWGGPQYMYSHREILPPMDRSPTNGFRCIRAIGDGNISEEAMNPLLPGPPLRDINNLKPVSDEIFEAYRGSYSYEETLLDEATEVIDDKHLHYVRETVSFNTAYDDERVVAYLFFPKTSHQPYHPVIYFPGSGAQMLPSIDDWNMRHVDMIVKSGRAVIFPVFWGTFQRRQTSMPMQTRTRMRDEWIKLYKDLARTIDYLETRPEFDLEKLTYFGYSWGTIVGPVMGALEKRIRGFIFLSGGIMLDGLYLDPLPEYDQTIFAPRLMAPVLMIIGRYDLAFPLETSTKPFFDLLGTPEKDKKFVILNSGHAPPMDSKLIKEILDWLEHYFGQLH